MRSPAMPLALLAVMTVLLRGGIAFAADAGGESPMRIDMATAISIALERNTDLAIARMRKERAYHQKNEALGMAMPDMNLSGSFTHQGNIQKVEFGGMQFQFAPDEEYVFSAGVSQYLYSGAVSSGYRAATHILAAAGKSLDAARNDVITDVKIRMYDTLFTRDLIRVNRESVAQLRSHLEDSKAREEVGLNTSYDTMRFETQVADAVTKLIEARNNHSKAVAALLNSLGMSPLTDVDVVGDLAYDPVVISLNDAVDRANKMRPELLAAQENLDAAREVTGAAKSELLPTVKAFGNYSYSNLGVGIGGETLWRNDWNVGLKVEYNLFDGRERASRIGQRRVDEEIARLESEKINRMAMLEVKTAHEELSRAAEFVQSQEKSVSFAEETYRIASEKRKEGVITQLELLDAQLALTRAKINHSHSLYEYSLARLKLERAMGDVETSVE